VDKLNSTGFSRTNPMNFPLGFSLILAKAKRMIDSLLFWLKPFVVFTLSTRLVLVAIDKQIPYGNRI